MIVQPMSDVAIEYYVINGHVLNTEVQILYYNSTDDGNKIIELTMLQKVEVSLGLCGRTCEY